MRLKALKNEVAHLLREWLADVLCIQALSKPPSVELVVEVRMDFVELDVVSSLHVDDSMAELMESYRHVDACAGIFSSEMHFIPPRVAIVFFLSWIIEVDFHVVFVAYL